MMMSLINVTRVQQDGQESGHFALSDNRAISKRRTVLRCFRIIRLCAFREKNTRLHCPYLVPLRISHSSSSSVEKD